MGNILIDEDSPVGKPDAEAPEWLAEDFAQARRGAPWLWPRADAANALRETAAELRARADDLEEKADRLLRDAAQAAE